MLASVYAVPDPVVGDQVMAAVQLRPGLDALDGESCSPFLAAQGDLGTKWTPRFVRMSAELPGHRHQQGTQARPAGRALEQRRPGALAAREGRGVPRVGTGRSERARKGDRGSSLLARRILIVRHVLSSGGGPGPVDGRQDPVRSAPRLGITTVT